MKVRNYYYRDLTPLDPPFASPPVFSYQYPKDYQHERMWDYRVRIFGIFMGLYVFRQENVGIGGSMRIEDIHLLPRDEFLKIYGEWERVDENPT